jgi:hypothetical protein
MTNRLTFDYVTKHFPNTDKAGVGYLSAYNGFLPDKMEKLLEIGVWKGDGIRTIRHFYNGEGEYHAMNYVFGDAEGHIPSIEEFEKEGIKCHIGYDYDTEAMSKITDQFDVIIEDASHCSDSQIICFKHFLLNNLKTGGVYFLEDLHCCPTSPHWRNITRFEDTLLHLFREVIKGGTFESFMISADEDKAIRARIKEITIIGGMSHGIIGVINA